MGETKIPVETPTAENVGDKVSRSDSIDKLEPRPKSPQRQQESQDEKLARRLRENLAKRKSQSRARNTKPRKFKNSTT